MLDSPGEYEADRMSSEQVQRFIEFQMEGLERIGLREIHAARELTHRLVSAHFSDGVEEFIDVEQVRILLSDLRRFLRSLPDSFTAKPDATSDSSGPVPA